jgi:DNA-binding LacI/PurR family transcriptional regulator
MSTPLTTLSVPRFELGRRAVQVLTEIENGTAKHENILPCELIKRKSVLQWNTHD